LNQLYGQQQGQADLFSQYVPQLMGTGMAGQNYAQGLLQAMAEGQVPGTQEMIARNLGMFGQGGAAGAVQQPGIMSPLEQTLTTQMQQGGLTP
jgi:hypothetical protein